MYTSLVLVFFGMFLLIFPVTAFFLALTINYFKDKADEVAFAKAQAAEVEHSGHYQI